MNAVALTLNGQPVGMRVASGKYRFDLEEESANRFGSTATTLKETLALRPEGKLLVTDEDKNKRLKIIDVSRHRLMLSVIFGKAAAPLDDVVLAFEADKVLLKEFGPMVGDPFQEPWSRALDLATDYRQRTNKSIVELDRLLRRYTTTGDPSELLETFGGLVMRTFSQEELKDLCKGGFTSMVVGFGKKHLQSR